MKFIFALFGALAVVTPFFFIWEMARRRAEKSAKRALLDDYNMTTTQLPKSSNNLSSARIRIIPRVLQSRYGTWFKAVATRSGTWKSEEIDRLVGRKFELCVATLAFGALVTNLLHGAPFLYLLLFPSIAFILPDLLLVNKASKRVAHIEEVLPETIDLLNMCVNAGLGFQAGMLRVAESQDNPLAEEFNRVLAEMRLGQSRSNAFRDLADRINLEPLRQFVNSVLQVDRLGVPVTKVLEDQAVKMRQIRKERAREQAQKVPVKILLPIMLFLLPAMMIIVLGPAIISVIRAFS